jgi:PilZ domain
MGLLQSNTINLPHSQERRRHQRVRVNLLGRYMLADKREYPCQVVNMSPGGIALIAPICGKDGERVIAYIDHFGRLEGRIARQLQNGFAMTIQATSQKRDKLAAQLTWLANRSLLNLPNDRRHGRFVPKVDAAHLIMPNGTNIGVRIVDLSLSGAGILTQHRPEVGSLVKLGNIQGRIIRHLEEGLAMEFMRLQHPDSIEEAATAQ